MRTVKLTREGIGMAVGELRDPRLTEDGFKALCVLVDRSLRPIMGKMQKQGDEEMKRAFRSEINVAHQYPYLDFFSRQYRIMEKHKAGQGKHIADAVWHMLENQEIEIPGGAGAK